MNPFPEDQQDAEDARGKKRRQGIRSGIALLILLPTRPPGVPLQDLLADLGVSRRSFFRLMADLRDVGFDIESETMPDGRRGYWVGRRGQGLMKKFGLE